MPLLLLDKYLTIRGAVHIFETSTFAKKPASVSLPTPFIANIRSINLSILYFQLVLDWYCRLGPFIASLCRY